MIESHQHSEKFTKTQRLLKPYEFQHVFQHGMRLRKGGFRAHLLMQSNILQLSTVRLGITVPKRCVAKATQRNMLRRQIREHFRIRKHHMPAGLWLVIAVTTPVTDTLCNIRDTLSALFDLIQQKTLDSKGKP